MAQVWSRPLGLAGVWGAMVEDWLDELLPDDADAICRDRVHLRVSHIMMHVIVLHPRLGLCRAVDTQALLCKGQTPVSFAMDLRVFRQSIVFVIWHKERN